MHPTRRQLLQTASCGFGSLALAGMIGRSADASRPSNSSKTHFDAKAKRVLFLCMSGGPSHVDSFDYKPRLQSSTGQTWAPPGSLTAGGRLLGSPWKFQQRGQSGLYISDLFPQIASQADRLCVLHGMQTNLPAHPQAFLEMHTGSSQFVRPSLGSWVVYGLGQENENLPGFISLSPPSGNGGGQNHGGAFLPAKYQGTPIDVKRGNAKFANIENPILNPTNQRRQLDFIQTLNQSAVASAATPDDALIDGIIESHELAFRMQDTVPDVMAVDKESLQTQSDYGLNNSETATFGRQCLMARRLLEAGVRFVEVTHHGWDQHSRLQTEHGRHAAAVDQPIAALLNDLSDRGLLDETLVLWGGEFGRSPVVQGVDGRDHNHRGYTMWMAGGGVKPGYAYGSTDEIGRTAVAGQMHTHDLHATILHLLGLDHTRLTYPYAGRDYRLTDVHGTVAKDILR